MDRWGACILNLPEIKFLAKQFPPLSFATIAAAHPHPNPSLIRSLQNSLEWVKELGMRFTSMRQWKTGKRGKEG